MTECFIESLVIHNNILKYLIVYKQIINSKWNYSNSIEINETIQLCEKCYLQNAFRNDI